MLSHNHHHHHHPTATPLPLLVGLQYRALATTRHSWREWQRVMPHSPLATSSMNEGSRRLRLTFEMEWGWDSAGWHRCLLFILSIVQSIIVSILYHSPFSYSVAFFNERTSNRGCIMDRLRCPSSYTGGGSHQQLQAHYYHATPRHTQTRPSPCSGTA